MKRIAPLLLLLLLLAALPLQAAATLTLAEYQAALTRIRSFLETGNVDGARAEGKALAGSEVDSPNGRFKADSTLLAEVAAAKPHDLGVENRIDATLASLHPVAPSKPIAVDAALMQRLQREQTANELRRGGDIHAVKVEAPLLTRIGDAIVSAGRWVGEEIVKFVDWLSRFWPDGKTEKLKKPASTPGMRWTIGALVALIILVLGVLAFEVIRRSRKAAPGQVEESAPLRSSRDDDPLSRGANEWERYAAQLAAAGRTREAIRAWYNAVLVTLYGASVLQFRKGRTNWEYVAALHPEIAWRPRFIDLTRRFEEEWYGSDQSSADALEECGAAARSIVDAVRRARREAA
ncbi:MAG TPA: DUF4129 domain-containing protein [Thermoanaerobaculia bacterium]|jgi:hypothetical protein|nr:DUF4129 domain-containing protein [Thermoanaerobaculia bacterium]